MGNFVAGIDHGKQAGTVIFGDKYVNPGKKLMVLGQQSLRSNVGRITY
jgi:hypothetical protein